MKNIFRSFKNLIIVLFSSAGLIWFIIMVIMTIRQDYEEVGFVAGQLFYFIFLGIPIMYLGRKLGQLIAKALFSLPAKPFAFDDDEIISIMISLIGITVVTALLVKTLQVHLVLPLPEWAPYYDLGINPIVVAISLFVTFLLAQIILACKYKFFTKK